MKLPMERIDYQPGTGDRFELVVFTSEFGAFILGTFPTRGVIVAGSQQEGDAQRVAERCYYLEVWDDFLKNAGLLV